MIPIYICEDNTVELAVIKKIITNLLFIEDYDMNIACCTTKPEDILSFLRPNMPVGIYFFDIDLQTDINGLALFIEDYDMNIACCTTKPEDILSFLRPNMPVGIYFFDIDLQTDINGLALAEKIREYDPSGYIIFITSHTDMWRLTFEYKVSALDFIEKCETKYLAQKIASCLSAIWRQYGKLNLQIDMWRLTFEYKVSALDFIEKCETKYLAQKIASCLSAIWRQYGKLNLQIKKAVPLQINGRILYKDIDDLLYMETTPPHRIKFCTATQVHFSVGNLNEFENLLPDYFFRCHRSFIINLKNIIFYDERIKFCTATQVHFSVGNLNEFENLLPDYFFRCHRSFIINLKNIIFYDEKKQIVYFTNQSSCPVSVRKRKALKDALNNI